MSDRLEAAAKALHENDPESPHDKWSDACQPFYREWAAAVLQAADACDETQWGTRYASCVREFRTRAAALYDRAEWNSNEPDTPVDLVSRRVGPWVSVNGNEEG